MPLPIPDLPDFPPPHRIGIKQRGLLLRPDRAGALAWAWARWSLSTIACRAILTPEEHADGLESAPLPGELLVPCPAETMVGWRVSDDSKNSRLEPNAGMAEAIPVVG